MCVTYPRSRSDFKPHHHESFLCGSLAQVTETNHSSAYAKENWDLLQRLISPCTYWATLTSSKQCAVVHQVSKENLSESGPLRAIISFSFDKPPIGTLSEPVANCSNNFFLFSVNSLCTISQKYLTEAQPQSLIWQWWQCNTTCSKKLPISNQIRCGLLNQWHTKV